MIKINKSKLFVFIFILLLILPFSDAKIVKLRGIISIPFIKINCNDLDEGIGEIFKEYYCKFYYSQLLPLGILDGCNLLVLDNNFNEVYYNKSIENAVEYRLVEDEDKYVPGTEVEPSHYNQTIDLNVPIKFKKEGTHLVTFSFDYCKNPNRNGIIETKKYDIFTPSSYYIIKEQNKNIKKLEEDNESMINLTKISILITLIAISIALISLFRVQKSFVVRIDKKLLNKILNKLKNMIHKKSK